MESLKSSSSPQSRSRNGGKGVKDDREPGKLLRQRGKEPRERSYIFDTRYLLHSYSGSPFMEPYFTRNWAPTVHCVDHNGRIITAAEHWPSPSTFLATRWPIRWPFISLSLFPYPSLSFSPSGCNYSLRICDPYVDYNSLWAASSTRSGKRGRKSRVRSQGGGGDCEKGLRITLAREILSSTEPVAVIAVVKQSFRPNRSLRG